VHGFIFSELEKYVRQKLGRSQWEALLAAAGLGTRKYHNFEVYEDAEAVKLVTTASEITGLAPAVILEDFGRFLGRDLVRIYRPLLDPRWKTLEFLENVENTVHRVVRSRNAARPPVLLFQRTSRDSVLLTYRSPRQLEELAVGIAHGVADHYGEKLSVSFSSRMSDGAPESKMLFTLLAPIGLD
jgi:hypothetical protein